MPVTQQMLDDAVAAYHRLMTGAAVAEFRDQNGETVKYSATNRNALVAYINHLKKELGIETTASGPMQVWM